MKIQKEEDEIFADAYALKGEIKEDDKAAQKEKDRKEIDRYEQFFYKKILFSDFYESVDFYHSFVDSLPDKLEKGLLSIDDIAKNIEDFKTFCIQGLERMRLVRKERVKIESHHLLIVMLAALYVVHGAEAAFNTLIQMKTNGQYFFGINMALGDMYYYGIGTPKDLKKASACYKRAIKLNETEESLAELLHLYYFYKARWENIGEFLSTEEFRAYSDALDIGSIQAGVYIGDNYLKRYSECIEKGVRDHDNELRKGAIEYFGKAAKQGEQDQRLRPNFDKRCTALAYNGLGYAYVNRDNKKDPINTKALECIIKAAELDLPAACHNAGYMYLNGIGTEEDRDEAIRWLTQAKLLGSKDAEEMLSKAIETPDQKK